MLESSLTYISFLDISIIDLSKSRILSNIRFRSLFIEKDVEENEKLLSSPMILIDLLAFCLLSKREFLSCLLFSSILHLYF